MRLLLQGGSAARSPRHAPPPALAGVQAAGSVLALVDTVVAASARAQAQASSSASDTSSSSSSAPGVVPSAFAICRPPGHHAGPVGVVTCKRDPHGSHGFCLLNNIMVTSMLILGGASVVNALTGGAGRVGGWSAPQDGTD